MTVKWTETPDRWAGDVAVGPLYADRPPTRGIAGWADWLLGDPLAALLIAGKVRAKPGEKLLLAGRAPFGAAKIVLVGCARPAADKNEASLVAEQFADAIAGLAPKRILVESTYSDPHLFVERFAARLSKGEREIFVYEPESPCRI